MYSIQYLHERFNTALAEQTFDFEPNELYEPIKYTLALGGKRFRPVLMLMGCDLFGGDIEKVINPAIGLEVFHNFTLLHDDIMDNAPIRRGKPSVYKKWNTNIAILSGDTMFAVAYSYVAETEKKFLPDVLKVFTRTAKEVCEGQQYDLNYESQEKVPIKDYMRMIRLKTAVLFGASLKIGSIIAGACEKDTENLYTFGENLGIAFQLKDDLLDIYGDESKFGKISGGDILDNKKTYPYLKALEIASGDTLLSLIKCFSHNSFDNKTKIKSVKKIYDQLKIKDFTLQEMEVYYQKAMAFFDKIDVDNERKRELLNFAKKIMDRDS
ncbi:MAG: polyprenyl synthetase family protein [Bacteroidetes bacterium]|nr:polyprenyl synthetase family protein [Bacteroidota bacterium]